MALSNELSSEIAAAMLVEKKSPAELNKLKDVILRVHSTLQKMSEEERAARTEDLIKRHSSRTKAESA
jgi:predicted transcriptional regulator